MEISLEILSVLLTWQIIVEIFHEILINLFFSIVSLFRSEMTDRIFFIDRPKGNKERNN